jgi:hypothetical protein
MLKLIVSVSKGGPKGSTSELPVNRGLGRKGEIWNPPALGLEVKLVRNVGDPMFGALFKRGVVWPIVN